MNFTSLRVPLFQSSTLKEVTPRYVTGDKNNKYIIFVIRQTWTQSAKQIICLSPLFTDGITAPDLKMKDAKTRKRERRKREIETVTEKESKHFRLGHTEATVGAV